MATPTHEERKVITALFCDLVGSTALGERLDHEEVARLLARYHDLCRRAIERHGGLVEKYIGDAVVSVFGVPAAHEDDPERAVRAGLAIIADLGRWEPSLQVRIGINTGEALVSLDPDQRAGRGFATGDTLNTAARLEAAAPPMEVVVGDATRRATRSAIAYERLPPVVAKGKADPLQAWRALGPLERAAAGVPEHTPFVGRVSELTSLVDRFTSTCASHRPATVTIVGEPGLGKSRLVRELRRRVDDGAHDAVWLTGRCLPYGDGISFWALGEIARSHARIAAGDDETTIAAKLDEALEGVDPHVRATAAERLGPLVGLPATSATPDRDETFTAWRRFLESLARSRPAVVVIEDLHWADDAFVSFLDHVTERAAAVPLLLVATARPEVAERHPSWPLGSAVRLTPLDTDAIDELLGGTLAGAGRDIVALVRERAGGSPLFAEQLAAMWRERGTLDDRAIPESVQALIAARIDALDPEPKRVLMEASVIGRRFWAGAVGAIGTHADVASALADLIRRQLITPIDPDADDPTFSFWHALVRDVAYAQLTRAERALLHAGTARWLRERIDGPLGASAEIVVHHLEAARELATAAPELDVDALTRSLAAALLDAGIHARASGNVASASASFQRAAVALPDDDAGRPELLRMLGGVLRDAGDPERALPVLDEAITLAHERHDRASEWRAIAERHDTARIVGSAGGARATVERWIPVLEADQDHLGLAKAHRILALTAWDEGRFAESERSTTRGVREARLAGDVTEAAEIAAGLALSDYWGPTPAGAGLERAARLIAEYPGNGRVECFVLGWAAPMHAMQGRFPDAYAAVARSAAIAEELGLARWFGFPPMMTSIVALFEGDLGRARSVMRDDPDGYESGEAASQRARVLLGEDRPGEAWEWLHPDVERDDDGLLERAERLSVGSAIARRLGDPAQAVALAERSITELRDADEAHLRPEAWTNLGLAEFDLGRGGDAVAHLRLALDAYAEKGNLVLQRRTQALLDERG